MGFRHVAALALVGWYLMLPPRLYAPRGLGAASEDPILAPLAQGEVFEAFDSAEECKTKIVQMVERAEKRGVKHHPRLDAMHRIASDDPRLKGD